jgi:outer membrane protein TolC
MTISSFGKCARALCILLCIIFNTPLWAQSRIYHLQDLVSAAAASHPSVKSREANVNSADAGIKDARHAALPLLKFHDQVTVSSANGAAGTFFPLGVIVPTAGAIRAENNYEPATGNLGILYTEYELANFGLNRARVEDAKANRELSQADLLRSVYITKLKTARDYFQLVKLYRQLGIEQENVNRYDTLFTIISAQAASGLRPGADSAQTKAELSKARVTYNIKYGQIEQLKDELSSLTGINASMLNIDTSYLNADIQVNANAEQLSVISPGNPFLDYYDKRKLLFLSKEKLIKKTYLPKILFVGGAWARGTSITYDDKYEALSSGLGYQRFNYGLGLAFTYNIFDLVHRRDKLAANRYDVQQKEYELKEEELDLTTSLHKADAALDVIQKNMEELPVQLESATSLYQQKFAQYQAGVSNLVDLTNAAFLLYQVQSDNVEIVTDWFLAKLDRSAAKGDLSQFIQSIK